MKILSEAKSEFNLDTAIDRIKTDYKKQVSGTTAEKIEMRENDIFLVLADSHPDITFILLDNNDNIIGWRN